MPASSPNPSEGFPAGTMILTLRGIVPVEDVTLGDKVFTHDRQWHPVTSTGRRIADTVSVHCASLTTGLTATAGRLFYTRTSPVLLAGGEADGMSAARWTTAADLTDRHRLASPIDFGAALPVPDLPAAADEAERFRAVGTMIRLKGAAAAAVRPDLVDWLAEHFGVYGAGRRFPAWVLTMPEELRRALLDGLVNDAPHREQFQTRMASKAFMVGMRLLVCSLGLAGGMSYQRKPSNDGWLLSWKREGGRRRDHDGHRWHRAFRVEHGPRTEVFTLRVSGSGSLVADGITTHSL
ncbi:Hint domain-containing protein [Streptomyces sp. NPDC126510]|uniref:Hint domain-containing protein n=1 Tax=Streptomyces sp. NPDC126510 TaxID=3155317 RepID=UPI00332DF8E9